MSRPYNSYEFYDNSSGHILQKQIEELQPNDTVKEQQERCGNDMRGGRDGTSIAELMQWMLETMGDGVSRR